MSAPTADHRSLSTAPRPAGTAPALTAGMIGTLVAAAIAAGAADFGIAFLAASFITHLVVTILVARHVAIRHRAPSFGLPNILTLARAGATALVCGYGVELLVEGPPTAGVAAAFAALAAVSILADGLDGLIARRVGPATAFGARFDMEVDALLIAALSVVALALGKAGILVLAIGLMRYAFVAAMIAYPWLDAPLPPSFRRKAVCVLQGVVLVALASPMVDRTVGEPMAMVAVAALVWSFGSDVLYLMARRTRARA